MMLSALEEKSSKMKKKTAAAKGVERGAAPALASAQRSEHFTKGLEDARPTTQ